MDLTIDQRTCELAVYIIETGATVRACAKRFGISKSTVHKDLAQRLPKCNKALYGQVRQVLEENKAQRHIRGGLATREKYKKAAPQTSFSTDRLHPAPVDPADQPVFRCSFQRDR